MVKKNCTNCVHLHDRYGDLYATNWYTCLKRIGGSETVRQRAKLLRNLGSKAFRERYKTCCDLSNGFNKSVSKAKTRRFELVMDRAFFEVAKEYAEGKGISMAEAIRSSLEGSLTLAGVDWKEAVKKEIQTNEVK